MSNHDKIVRHGLGQWLFGQLLWAGIPTDQRLRVVKSVFQRVGENDNSNLKILGTGQYAAVGWLPHDHRKVLKVTKDEDDAMALEAIRQDPAKQLVKVYDVFKITPGRSKNSLFGIVTQKLTPLSAMDEEMFFYDLEDLKQTARSLPFGIGYEGDLNEAASELNELYHEAEDREDEAEIEKFRDVFAPIFKNLKVWNKECYDRGIAFHDLSPGNVMMNRNVWTLMDFGHNSQTPYFHLPQLELIDMPEDV